MYALLKNLRDSYGFKIKLYKYNSYMLTDRSIAKSTLSSTSYCLEFWSEEQIVNLIRRVLINVY